MNCRQTSKQTVCSGQSDSSGSSEAAHYDSFNLCLPFGASLSYDGTGLKYTEPKNISGTGLVKVIEGCVTDLVAEEVPIYTPPPCTPAVSPCDDSGSSTSGSGVILSSDSSNLLTWDSSGYLLGALNVRAGSNITITGAGTATDVMVISGSIEPNDTFVTAGTPNLITVTGQGTQASAYNISHVRQASSPAQSTGLVVDDGGHVVSYEPPTTAGLITSVVGIPGVVDVETTNTVVSVTLPTMSGLQPIPPKIVTSDRIFSVDVYGRITGSEMAETGELPYLPFSMILTGARTIMTHQFITKGSAKFRIKYSGNAGSATGNGLITPPAGWDMTVDLQSVDFYLYVVNGTVMGAEALTADSYLAGTHLVTLTVPAEINTPGILDIVPCQ